MLPLGESALCEWRSPFLDSLRKVYTRIHTQRETARRKVAGTEQFIKNSTLTRWEGRQAQRGQLYQGLGVSFLFTFALVMDHSLGGSPTEVVSNRLRDSSYWLGQGGSKPQGKSIIMNL